ncbi:hypothetical protein HW423_04580 [Aerococcaceae bacterium INB8]|uniref:Uncharacterized protein n=1 Tax=Ruoffia halotolerans TaxID=2748684 RepID=A0A839A4X9_9LACT|nr:hypothetical protein [Ruoffia halotolerans]MBA5729057.1 hypothetical protein [Ruoffia halotolerans]
MSKRKTSFSMRMLVALVLGLALVVAVDLVGTNLGTIYTDFVQSEIIAWFGLLETGFLCFLRMLEY